MSAISTERRIRKVPTKVVMRGEAEVQRNGVSNILWHRGFELAGSEMADDDAKKSFAPPVKKRNELGLPGGLVRALKWIFVTIFLTSIVIGVVGIFL